MEGDSASLVLRRGRRLRWLWLLGPALAAVAWYESFIVLQVFSAILLFTVFFLIGAAIVGAFLVVLAALDQILHWSAVAAVFVGRALKASFLEIGVMATRASLASHLHAGGRTRN